MISHIVKMDEKVNAREWFVRFTTYLHANCGICHILVTDITSHFIEIHLSMYCLTWLSNIDHGYQPKRLIN